MCAVVLRRRPVISLEWKEAVFGVEQVADSLVSHGVVERSQDEKAAADRLTRGQTETGSDPLFVNLELGHAELNRNSSDLANGSDARRVASHEMEHQAENSLRKTCGDGDGQG